jgi:hypothetical protein
MPGATSSATRGPNASASSARRPSVACGETTLPYGNDDHLRRAAALQRARRW